MNGIEAVILDCADAIAFAPLSYTDPVTGNVVMVSGDGWPLFVAQAAAAERRWYATTDEAARQRIVDRIGALLDAIDTVYLKARAS